MILAALILSTASKASEPAISTRYFTYSICSLPDINSDGVPDLAFGFSADKFVQREYPYRPTFKDPGHLWIVSGKDGVILQSFKPQAGDVALGVDVCAVEQDGHVEVWSLAICKGETVELRLGIYVFDPATGASVRHLLADPMDTENQQPFFVPTGLSGNAPRLSQRPWICLYNQGVVRTWPQRVCEGANGCSLGPWNCSSWAASAGEADTFTSLCDFAAQGLFIAAPQSGTASKRVLRNLVPLHVQQTLIDCMSTGPDLDADGVPDIAFIVRNDAPPTPSESVLLVSGKSLNRIREIPIPHFDAPLAYACVAFVGDEDGDGVADIAVETETQLNVFSSKTAKSLFKYASRDDLAAVRPAHDFNGDGIADLIVGTGPQGMQSLPDVCRATILSGKDGSELMSIVVEEEDHLKVTRAHH